MGCPCGRKKYTPPAGAVLQQPVSAIGAANRSYARRKDRIKIPPVEEAQSPSTEESVAEGASLEKPTE